MSPPLLILEPRKASSSSSFFFFLNQMHSLITSSIFILSFGDSTEQASLQFQGLRQSTHAHWYQFGTSSQYHEFLLLLEFHFRCYLYYYLRGFSCLDSSFFSSKMPLHLYVLVETKLKDNLVKIQL